jgi:hypothetical protein
LKSIAPPSKTIQNAPRASGVESLAREGNPIIREITVDTIIGLPKPNFEAIFEILRKIKPEKNALMR